MKKINFLSIIPFAFILFYSCAPSIPSNVKYSQKLSENENLAKYANQFLKDYEGKKQNQASLAYLALFQGNFLNATYNVSILSLKQDDSNNIVSHIESITNKLTQHLSYYSEIWSNSITNHIQNKNLYVDFSTALFILNREYQRIGVFTKLDEIKDLLKSKVMTLDKNQKKSTLELYAIVNQLIDLCEEPKGSLRTFNSTVNSLSLEISKISPLAELEY